jgi:uncharacterized protein YfaS (alpha-2-macroglobulin family)
MIRCLTRLLVALAVVAVLVTPATAQSDDKSPAFSLSSSEVFTTRDNPSFHLTFRHLPQLDFRVYKVRDATAFFAGLSDPHQLGSFGSVPVPTEKSWIERLTDWKRGQRRDIRVFVRNQVSAEYREERRAARDKVEVARRVTLNRATFAQVPLLNPNQLVTSWREILPDLADSEMRRLPLEVKEPGVYVVEAVSGGLRAYTLVMVSDVGLVSKVAPGQLFVFAANRLTGEPHAGCDVRVLADRKEVHRGATNADGVFEVSLGEGKAEESKVEDVVALADCGNQVAVTAPGGYFLSQPARELVGYVYTDKPVYRPGHAVHVKAVLRWRERDALRPFDRRSVELRVSDTNEKVIRRQSVTIDEFGAAHASFQVPDNAALGDYSVVFASGVDEARGSFSVEEYRKPEFEVIVTPATRFVVQGQDAVAQVQARYYFGQPVANASVRYVVSSQGYYSPFRWNDASEGEGESDGYSYGGPQQIQGELRLDAEGRGQIRVPTTPNGDGQDYSLRIEAQATDASSREVSGNTTVHATVGSFLIALDLREYFFRPGQRVTTAIRAVDYVGTPKAGVPVKVVLERLTYPNGYYQGPTIAAVGSTMTTLDGSGTGTATVTLGREPGSYRIRATATEDNRPIRAETSLWVPGEEFSVTEGDRYLELLADKKTYAPGDTAHLLVQGEQVEGTVLLTKEGQHVTWHRVVTVAPGAALDVPIDADDVGDVYVNVAYLRNGRLNRAERRLAVPAVDRTLRISVTADAAVSRPQQPGVFTVRVTNASGAPVRAQVSLGVIDEAVYAIKPEATPDPVRFFYRREYSRVGTSFSRDYHFYGYAGTDRLQLAGRTRRPFSLADFKGDPEGRPQVRKDFPDAIYWIGDLVTDINGTAKVALKYPDALTTWRLTARGVTTDTMLGSAVTRTTTTKDLIVRVITPRFLTQGDQVVLPTVAHNYLKEAKDATVSVETTGLQPAQGVAAPPVTSSIASRGERRDDWRYLAPTVGTATITAAVRTDTDSDAVELPIPVLPRGLRRESGSSGSLFEPGDATASLTIPEASNPAGRSVKVSLAPSMAGSMLGALDFLTSFPYGCTEQTLSSFLPNLVVSRALGQLKLVPTERMSVLDRQTSDGLKRLLDLQHDDGGWGWWKSDENHPFMTAYALYGLAEAKREGYPVDEERFAGAVRALVGMYAEYPRAVPDLKAYMAFVLGRADPGASMRPRLDELWNARDRMTAYGRSLLLLALDDAKDARGTELAARLMSEAQTTGDLSFWSSDSDPLMFDFVDTRVEATATAIRALARRDPRNPLLDRAVRWLMLNRSGGYWMSTKQTAIALYGLLELLQARNETPQTFTADVFVNDELVGSRTFTPTSLVNPDPVVMTAPGRAGANSVRIAKRGGGTLYWSATSVHFDTQAAEARIGTRQLALVRTYALLTPVRQPNGNIVYREQPLRGPIQPGDVLTVRLVAAGSKDWRYLVLEDPLPAGVEAIQDTTAYPLERPVTNWWWGSKVEYRDNRTVFFQEAFEQGRYEFMYLVKAISSGEFNAVPAQMAPMYVPGVTASSEPMTVTVSLPGASR